MGKNDRVKRLVIQECKECGTTVPIWRLRSKLKDSEHVKHMWCHVCKRVTAHVQKGE